jgi:hypothetical protein
VRTTVQRIDRWVEGLLEESPADEQGTKVLVAVDGFSAPGKECVDGELLWPWSWCGRRGCSCGADLHGIATHGEAALGRVRRIRAAPRALVEAEIVASMSSHPDVADPEAEARAFLDEVAEIPDGRLVRREEGVLLPFPSAARITAEHHIEYRLTDEP